MSSLTKMLRYVHDVAPPTLWSKLQEVIAEMQSGQSGEKEETEQLVYSLLKRKPATIRQMCLHERDMPMLDMLRLKALLEISAEDFSALYMAAAPASLVGDIVRISHLAGPQKEAIPCQPCAAAFVRPRYWKGGRKI